ncbi:hypothetical protein T440DRAFT_463664 [Plenodomus tracheiphilus IPT5]|uniref:Uncharacterized protein n=1 Tax=Plenodomus tracheiphilus IPT5 TaxID=1408161 RepID=A0A6A7BLM1_9PLEO|nr:hypothetical protein T440DRAFT_463664 [Plenodomus tracheiphilus IPT5]
MLLTRQCTPRLAAASFTTKASCQRGLSVRMYSDTKAEPQSKQDDALESIAKPTEVKAKKKTQAELDQEMLVKLQGLDGDGGSAGVEYEDGKPVSMKRSVKSNMFRYI